MRKIYSFFVTVLLLFVCMSVHAINVTVVVDDPSRVDLSVNYVHIDTLRAGDNHFSVEEYQSISMRAKDNAFITKVVRSMGADDSNEEYVSNMTSCDIYVYSTYEGATWTVTSVSSEDARDGECAVWVDDPANVRLQRSVTYSTVELASGWNKVKFIKGTESPFMIGAETYGTSLYQVKKNHEVMAVEGTMWRIAAEDGDSIEIFANFPDIDIPVTFKYSSDEAKGFVTGVTVNNEPVTNYNDANFTVKAGSSMSVSGNTNDYNLTSFSVNGQSQYFYGQYNFTVTDTTVIEIDAKKYGTVKATVNIDNPANVIVYRGYTYNNDIITMKEGANEVELSETNSMISIVAASGCYITSVTSGETSYSVDYSNAYVITLTDGMVVDVKSGAIERNSKAVMYVDDRDAASTYFNFQRGDRSSIDIVTGYNEFKFYEGDNPFGLSWYGASYSNVYKNDTLVSPMYEGSTTYELKLKDGDVVKLYLASDPIAGKVEFEIGEKVDTSKIAVTVDRIRTIKDLAKSFDALPGTEISITPADGYDVVISVNGDEISPAPDAPYLITAAGDTKVSISLPVDDGIAGVASDAAGMHSDVYNMQGIIVSRDADAAKINRLPAGVYIINGKKVVKR